MKLLLIAGIVLVAGQCVATKHDPPTSQETADALLAVALKRALVEAKDLPDFNLIDASPEIIVRRSIMSSPFAVRAAALPKVPGKQVLLLTREEIEARASQGGSVYFVVVDNLKSVRDAAEFTIGTNVAGARGDPSLCCCVEIVRYSLLRGEWVYEGAKGRLCS